jgi:hypothetical protein
MSERAAFAALAGITATIILASSIYIQRTPARPDLSAEAAGIVTAYSASLLDGLKGAQAASGPAGAVAFCRDQMPAIAAEITRRTGWTVGRTSLHTRNPAAAPDGYERTVMAGFAELIAVGTPVAALKESDVLGPEGAQVFRYVQAIPAGEVCRVCQGLGLAPEVKAGIKDLTPDDAATGDGLGATCGVFSLSKAL